MQAPAAVHPRQNFSYPRKRGLGATQKRQKSLFLLGIEPQFFCLSATILVTVLTDANSVVSSGLILIISPHKMSFFQTRSCCATFPSFIFKSYGAFKSIYLQLRSPPRQLDISHFSILSLVPTHTDRQVGNPVQCSPFSLVNIPKRQRAAIAETLQI